MDRIQIEGKNPCIEALRSGQSVDRLLVLDTIEKHKIHDILELAKQNKAIVEYVPKQRLDRIAESHSHQGIIAMVASIEYVDFETMIDRAMDEDTPPLFLILDEIQDPHNLGAIIRSANCAGVCGVIVPQRRSAPLSAVAYKASAGAISYVDIARVSNLANAIDYMKNKNIWIAGTDADGTICYETDLTGALALVIGSEGDGLRRLTKEKCDFVTAIPMRGDITSLNASVAAGVLMFESVRQRRKSSK